MKYADLKQIFRELKCNSPRKNLTAHVIFTEDSFTRTYPLLSRTYRFTSDNKAFWPNMGGYSIFAYCLDVTSDQGVWLDWYMAEEGNPGDWKVENCYILEQMRDAKDIPDCTRTEQEGFSFSPHFFLKCFTITIGMISQPRNIAQRNLCAWTVLQFPNSGSRKNVCPTAQYAAAT